MRRAWTPLLAILLTAPVTTVAADRDAPVLEVVVGSDGELGDSGLVASGSLDLSFGPARGAVLGVHVLDVTPELRAHWGADRERGVLISRVVDGGAAARAGLHVGDLVLAIDGESVASSSQVRAAIRPRRGGDEVIVEVLRERQPVRFTAILEERERGTVDLAPLVSLKPGEKGYTVRIDPNTFTAAQKRLQEALAQQDWRGWLEKLDELPGSNDYIEKRMQELEERLHELEQQLAEESPEER